MKTLTLEGNKVKIISEDLSLKLFKFYDYIRKESEYYYVFYNGDATVVHKNNLYKYQGCSRVYAYTMDQAADIILPVLIDPEYEEHNLIIEGMEKIYYKKGDSILNMIKGEGLEDLIEKMLNKLADDGSFREMC